MKITEDNYKTKESTKTTILKIVVKLAGPTVLNTTDDKIVENLVNKVMSSEEHLVNLENRYPKSIRKGLNLIKAYQEDPTREFPGFTYLSENLHYDIQREIAFGVIPIDLTEKDKEILTKAGILHGPTGVYSNQFIVRIHKITSSGYKTDICRIYGYKNRLLNLDIVDSINPSNIGKNETLLVGLGELNLFRIKEDAQEYYDKNKFKVFEKAAIKI